MKRQGPADPDRRIAEGWLASIPSWGVASIILAVLVSMTPPLLLFKREPLCSLFFDDAFYYFQVARNAAAGQGWTFDGIHPTNGFHPLWMLVLVPLFALFSGDVAPLRLIGLLETALIAMGCIGIFRCLSTRVGPREALWGAGLVIALPGARSILRNGLESALFFALLVLVWWVWQRTADTERLHSGRAFLLGICCALAFLARLEAALLVPVVLTLSRGRLIRNPRATVAFLIPPGLAAAGYMLWNRVLFDTWMPVSSLVKSHMTGNLPLSTRLGGVPDLPWVGHDLLLRAFGVHQFRAVPWSGKLLYTAMLVGIAAALWRHRVGVFAAVRRSGISLVLLASAAIVVADIVSVVNLPEWYRVPILLSTALFAASLSTRIPPRWWKGLLLVTALMIVIRSPLAAWKIGDGERMYAFYRIQAADWLRENTKPETRVGSWNAGMLGYFSHRPVVNLDGLANDREYFERVVRSHELSAYLESENIHVLADQVCGEEPHPGLYLRRFGGENVETEFRLARAFYNHSRADSCPGYAVWQRSRPGFSPPETLPSRR